MAKQPLFCLDADYESRVGNANAKIANFETSGACTNES